MSKPIVYRRLAALVLFCLALADMPHAIATNKGRVSFQSDHFYLTVARGKSEAVPAWLATLEAIWKHHTTFYAFAPNERIQCVLLDEEDFSNGLAYAAKGWVVLYLPPAAFDLRAATHWFTNVAAHEIAHIFTLQKMGLTSRFFGMQWLIDIETRQRIRHYHADFLWLNETVPAWLAEGLAQYGSRQVGYDSLDVRRRMLIHQAARDGSILSLAEMATFSSDARASELIYAQGFALVQWLYDRHGVKAMNRMMEMASNSSWQSAFTAAFGKNPDQLYLEWKATLRPDSVTQLPALDTDLPQALPYAIESHPLLLKTGELCFASSRDNAYGGLDLMCRDTHGRVRRIMRRVETPMHLSEDGYKVIFPANRIQASTGASLRDLYRYDGKEKTVTRLTKHERALSGIESTDGSLLYLTTHAGKSRFIQKNPQGVKRTLTAPDSLDFHDIALGRHTQEILITVVNGLSSDIYALDLSSGRLEPVVATPHQEIDPMVAQGRLHFSSDRDGRHRIYALSADTLSTMRSDSAEADIGNPARETLLVTTGDHPSLFDPHAYGEGGLGGGIYATQYGRDGFSLVDWKPEWKPAPEPVSHAHQPRLATPPVLAEALRYDRTRMEWVGYGLAFGYRRQYAQKLEADALDEESGVVSLTLNPCQHIALQGTQSLWMDPAQTNQAILSLTLGQCLEEKLADYPYVADGMIAYTLHAFAPDIVFMGQYQGIPLMQESESDATGMISLYQSLSGPVFRPHHLWSFMPFFLYQGVSIDLPADDLPKLSGLGLAAGQIIDYADLDFATDFIARGLRAQMAGLLNFFQPEPTYTLSGNFGFYSHAMQRLFLSLEGQAERWMGMNTAYRHSAWAELGYWQPLRTQKGLGQGRGPLFRSLALRIGSGLFYDASSADENDVDWSGSAWRTGPGNPWSLIRKSTGALPKRGMLERATAAAPLSSELESRTIAITQLAASLKTLGIFPVVAYWHASVAFESANFKNARYALSLSL
jgi:Peptidase MA superfamily